MSQLTPRHRTNIDELEREPDLGTHLRGQHKRDELRRGLTDDKLAALARFRRYWWSRDGGEKWRTPSL
ncbi:hypothetical protein ACFX1R_030192 [Malus domestica]